jgi:hypothetical protein
MNETTKTDGQGVEGAAHVTGSGRTSACNSLDISGALVPTFWDPLPAEEDQDVTRAARSVALGRDDRGAVTQASIPQSNELREVIDTLYGSHHVSQPRPEVEDVVMSDIVTDNSGMGAPRTQADPVAAHNRSFSPPAPGQMHVRSGDITSMPESCHTGSTDQENSLHEAVLSRSTTSALPSSQQLSVSAHTTNKQAGSELAQQLPTSSPQKVTAKKDLHCNVHDRATGERLSLHARETSASPSPARLTRASPT